MKTFLISLPRSRSTLVYELLRGYHIQKYGLKEIHNHPEFFLEWGRNMELCDRKVNKYFTTELYPVAHKNGVEMHFVYPWILKDTESRNHYKINLLKQEKQLGNEYYIKGTLNIAKNCKEILDFYKDRKIIITEREDVESMYMSFFFAWESKIFHARHNNLELYKNKLNKGVIVPEQIILDYILFVEQLNKIKQYLKDNNFNYSVLTYEDLENIDTISDVVETDEWKNYADFNSLPIEIKKDYKKLIHNYNEVKEILINRGAL
jgi:hypothetical protein